MYNQIKFLTLILIAPLIGCNQKPTRDDIVKKNIEAYILPKLDDPKSYEFAEINLIDSVLYMDNIMYRKELWEDLLKSDQEKLKEAFEMQKSGTFLVDAYPIEDIKRIQKEIQKMEDILLKLKLIESDLGDTVSYVASYLYEYSYQANNEAGALVLNRRLVQTKEAPNYEILNISTDKKHLYLEPNRFPGFDELIKKLN